MKLKSNEAGVCPFCGGTNLDYGTVELEGEMCYYPYKCLECGHEGEEWYEMSFSGHNIIDENNECIEVTDDMLESNE